MKEKIGANTFAEPGDRGCIHRNALPEGTVQLVRHYGDIFLVAEHIAKCHADEFYILLPDILHYIIV